VFSRDPDSPAIREVLSHGGRATTVIDGWLCVLRPDSDPDPLVEVVDIPMTLAGLSRFNVENALGAASAALAVGLPREAVVEGLTSFRPDPEHNPGRMNFFSGDDVSVVVDLAHNEAGLEALLEIMNGVRRPGARLLLALGAVGDRQDDVVAALGEMGARDADVVVVAHKAGYLRGRTTEELDEVFRQGAARVGVEELASYPTEVAGLEALVEQAEPGDVVALMCHEDRQGVYAWLADHGFTADSPETLRDKVRAARG
jgi:cyanophycin synthetase